MFSADVAVCSAAGIPMPWGGNPVRTEKVLAFVATKRARIRPQRSLKDRLERVSVALVGSRNELSPMINIFTLANDNRASIQEAYDQLLLRLDEADTEPIERFAVWAEATALISLNTKLDVVVELLNQRPYQNIYEWANESARLSSRPVDDLLRERLGPFYLKRITFDDEFENGRSFRYGALNAGGTGALNYGQYCIVLNKPYQLRLVAFVCIPGDSLQICSQNDGSFDVGNLENRVAPQDHAHLLVTTERAQEIPTMDEAGWPTLVASADRNFEVIFLGEIALDAVEEIRLSLQEFEAKWDLTFLNLGEKRSEAERAIVSDFLQLRRAEVDGRVKVEVLA
jgi:hypothetical protein